MLLINSLHIICGQTCVVVALSLIFLSIVSEFGDG